MRTCCLVFAFSFWLTSGRASLYGWGHDANLLFEQSWGQKGNSVINMVQTGPGTNWGEAELCDKSANVSFVLRWHPKTISLSETNDLMSYLHTHAITEFDHGMVRIDLYLEDLADPILTLERDVQCKKIGYPLCPMQKGALILFADLRSKNDIQFLPQGAFRIVFNVTNEKNQVALCAKFKIDIVR